MYIACPKCDWRPQSYHQWTCSCEHKWHIFDTDGVCPACGREWVLVHCFAFLGCDAWSDRKDWVHHEDTRTVEEFLVWDRRERLARQAKSRRELEQDSAGDSGEDFTHGPE